MSFSQGIGAGPTPEYGHRSANSFSFTHLGWTRQHQGYAILNVDSTRAPGASPENCFDMQESQNATVGTKQRGPLEWLRIGEFDGSNEIGERDPGGLKQQKDGTLQESPRTHFSLAIYPSVSLDGDEAGPSET